MALAGAALILKVEDERSPYQALILNLSEQYARWTLNLLVLCVCDLIGNCQTGAEYRGADICT